MLETKRVVLSFSNNNFFSDLNYFHIGGFFLVLGFFYFYFSNSFFYSNLNSIDYSSFFLLNSLVYKKDFLLYFTYFGDNLLLLANLIYTYFWLLFLSIGFIFFFIIVLVIDLTFESNKSKYYKRQSSVFQIYLDQYETVFLV
jgi:hypothetical protein